MPDLSVPTSPASGISPSNPTQPPSIPRRLFHIYIFHVTEAAKFVNDPGSAELQTLCYTDWKYRLRPYSSQHACQRPVIVFWCGETYNDRDDSGGSNCKIQKWPDI